MLFLVQEKKKDEDDDGWFDPFGPTIPQRENPSSPAEVPDVPKPNSEDLENVLQSPITWVVIAVFIYFCARMRNTSTA